MGSNSSSIQQKSVTNIQTNLNAEANATNTTLCSISGVEIVSVCSGIKIVNECNSSVKLESEAILEQTAETTVEALQDQTAQSGMVRFLNFNSATTSNEVYTYLEANLSNKCNVINNTQALISDIRIHVTSKPCIRSIKIYNTATAESQCTLSTTLSVFSNAELNAETTQQSGGFGHGSSADEGCGQALLVFMAIFLFLAVIMLLFFRHKKNSGTSTQGKRRSSSNNSDNTSGSINIDPATIAKYAKYAKYAK